MSRQTAPWIAGVVVLALTGIGQAQTLRDSDTPAEFPPASYSGTSYVDSRGCVYIRAGVGDATTWVPRVNRDRTIVCGRQPTFAGARPAPAQPARPAPEIELAAPTAPAARTTAPAAAPVAAARPVVEAPAVAAPQEERTADGRIIIRCPGPGFFSQLFMKRDPRCPARPTRTRPEPATVAAPAPVKPAPKPAPVVVAAPKPAPVVVAAPQPVRTRVEVTPAKPAAPVVRTQTVRVAPVRVPRGYERAFEDGRFNPHRGRGTALGDVQTALVWSNTIPRQLINRSTGEIVATVTEEEAPRLFAGTASVTASASSKSVAAAAAQWVQVGAYRANGPGADRATAQLGAAGLPVKVTPTARGGLALNVVYAGPFADASSAAAGLAAARRAGFADAFIR